MLCSTHEAQAAELTYWLDSGAWQAELDCLVQLDGVREATRLRYDLDINRH